jgi:hypothetical protein
MKIAAALWALAMIAITHWLGTMPLHVYDTHIHTRLFTWRRTAPLNYQAASESTHHALDGSHRRSGANL